MITREKVKITSYTKWICPASNENESSLGNTREMSQLRVSAGLKKKSQWKIRFCDPINPVQRQNKSNEQGTKSGQLLKEMERSRPITSDGIEK